jgi:uncharacterized membrane-anchored protein YitT (DUF2179 family)
LLAGASTGGTDVLARIGHKFWSFIELGQWFMLIDFVIIGAAALIFNSIELSLYGFVALVVSSYMIDWILQGANFAKMAYIISEKHEEIAAEILKTVKRGATGLKSRGLYNRRDAMTILCVVKKYEIPLLKKVVQDIDENAFLVFTQAREVNGEGFPIYPAP